MGYWIRLRPGYIELRASRQFGARKLAEVERIGDQYSSEYAWRVGVQSGTKRSEYAAMRAVRRALRAQEVSLDPRD